MQIVGIKLDRLRHAEYVRYMRDYLFVYDKNDPVALGITGPFHALTAKIDAIEDLFKQDRASELTEVIVGLDAERDADLISIAKVIQGYMGHYEANKATAAKRLNTRIALYGTPYGISRETLQGESTTIDNLIYDFQTEPELQAAVATLGLDGWIGRLKTLNDNLIAAYAARSEERGARPSEKIKDLRIEGNELYYTLRSHLLANALLAGYAAPYDTVIQETNAITGQYKQTLARRAGGAPDEGEAQPYL